MSQTRPAQIQRLIPETLHKLNSETNELNSLTRASPQNCKVNFEFGIAEDVTFTFLDKNELKRLTEALKKQGSIGILDFFCAIRYQQTLPDGKTKSLKSDHVLLRFAFRRKIMELFLVHERGIQHFPLEDLTIFLINRMNAELTQRNIQPLLLKNIRTLTL